MIPYHSLESQQRHYIALLGISCIAHCRIGTPCSFSGIVTSEHVGSAHAFNQVCNAAHMTVCLAQKCARASCLTTDMNLLLTNRSCTRALVLEHCPGNGWKQRW